MRFCVLLSAITFNLATTTVGATTQTRHVGGHKDHDEGFGLAFNAGSFTAANNCGGILRGFDQHKIKMKGHDEETSSLNIFHTISSASGGNIANVLYHFAKDTTTAELLDSDGISDPSKITTEILENIPEKSMFKPFAEGMNESLVSTIITVSIFGTDFWNTFMSIHLLQKFGYRRQGTLMTEVSIRDDVKSKPISISTMIGPPELHPGWLYQHKGEGIAQDLSDSPLPYMTVEGDDPTSTLLRTYYSSNNTYMLNLAKKYGYQIPVPAFGYVDEFRIPLKVTDTMKFDPVGNATAEDLNFKPFATTYDDLSTPFNPFTIEKFLGISTNVLSIFLLFFPPELRPLMSVPTTIDIPTADGEKRAMAFSDGVYNEPTGIPGLVQQKIRKIIAPYGPAGVSSFEVTSEVINIYSSFFGALNPSTISPDPDGSNDGLGDRIAFNHIFDINSNGENQLEKLANNMKSLYDEGEPMVFTLKGLDVIDNPFYGIEGGWQVDLTIILMLGVPAKFADQIPSDVAPPPIGKPMIEDGFLTNEEFKIVPNIATLGRDAQIQLEVPMLNITIDETIPGMGFDLPTKAVRMSHILGSWIVDRAWDGLKGSDGETKFEGFSAMFPQEIDVKEDNKQTDGSGDGSGDWSYDEPGESSGVRSKALGIPSLLAFILTVVQVLDLFMN